MSTDVVLPKIGFSMIEGTLTEWFVNHGDEVQEGQLIFAYESDKSVQEVESPGSGVIRIFGELGEVYQVGQLLALIE